MESKKLTPGAPCPDYPSVKQCSTACQNCRYNKFRTLNVQSCMPHTSEAARRKGAPQEASPNHMRDWMKKLQSKAIEQMKETI